MWLRSTSTYWVHTFSSGGRFLPPNFSLNMLASWHSLHHVGRSLEPPSPPSAEISPPNLISRFRLPPSIATSPLRLELSLSLGRLIYVLLMEICPLLANIIGQWLFLIHYSTVAVMISTVDTIPHVISSQDANRFLATSLEGISFWVHTIHYPPQSCALIPLQAPYSCSSVESGPASTSLVRRNFVAQLSE